MTTAWCITPTGPNQNRRYSMISHATQNEILGLRFIILILQSPKTKFGDGKIRSLVFGLDQIEFF